MRHSRCKDRLTDPFSVVGFAHIRTNWQTAMINNSKQDWTPGQTVKVGFLSLQVIAAVPTPGDFAPDAYILASKTAFYSFVPHNGLNKLTADEARAMIEQAKRHAAHVAATGTAAAAAAAAHAKLILDWTVTA
jgi:hypothetical protein